jgi:hypothetical protein
MEISDDDVLRYGKMQRQDKEYVHGQMGVEAARIRGILPDTNLCWQVDEEDTSTVKLATEDITFTLDH